MATQTPTTPVRAVLRNAANVVLSNTAFTSVFANKPVAAITYEIEANLLVSIGAAAAVSLILQLTGPAAGAETNVKWRASYEAGTGESVFAGHSIGSLASVTLPAGATFPANAVVHVWLAAHVVFTATGNANLQAELSVASATSQVSLGSTIKFIPVG